MASPFNELPIPMSFSSLELGSDLVEYSTETLSILADGFVITSQKRLRLGDLISLRLRILPGQPDEQFWEIRRVARVVSEKPLTDRRLAYKVEYETVELPA